MSRSKDWQILQDECTQLSIKFGNYPQAILNPLSAGTVFIRQNLMSVDIKLFRINT